MIHSIARLARAASLFAYLSAAPVFAQAQQDRVATDAAVVPDPATITVSATRLATDTQKVPATVTVVTDEKMADQLVNDVKDLVRFEPGVSVPRQPARFGAASGTTGRAGNEGFIVRGIGGNRVLIQVDGVRVPDGFTFGAQSVGRGDYVDLGLVKSVEILRGPASALYGSDGLAGAISFTTADPGDFLTGGKAVGGLVRAGYQSSDQEWSETGILAGRSGDWSAMVAYTRRDFSELENQGSVGGSGAARTKANPQDGDSNAVLGRIVYEPGTGHKLRLTGEYLDNHLDSNVLTSVSASVAGTTANDATKRKRAAFDWTWDGQGAIQRTRLSLYWQQAKDRQFSAEDRVVLADRTRLNTFDNRVFGGSGEIVFGYQTGALRHRLIVGADASRTRQEGIRDGTVPPVGETYPTRAFPITDFTLAGLFVSDEISLGPVTLFPALRFDHYALDPKKDAALPAFNSVSQSGSRVSPKIGATVALGSGLSLFANYAQGFKAPEPSQVNQFFQNLAFGYRSEPNPKLKPETSRSVEGGIRFGGGGVRVQLTGFHADYDNFISQEVVGGAFTPANPAVYQFINLDEARVNGIEGRVDAQLGRGFSANLAFAYADGDVIRNGKKASLSTVDPAKIVGGLGYRAPDGAFGGQLIVTHSTRKEASATTGVCTAACFRPDAFTIVDATAFVRVTNGLTLRAGIFNLLDKKYAWWNDVRGLAASSTITDAYTQPGRNGSVSLSYRF
ncbi:TonB-dependent hemoglobin/transferrin/lactoferrin family receptor [Sphingomonas pokkalii]|uniref:TonB-dependent hemoglobin/transferrin/lactoferrin family receptor n=1 Tax=Sphingomonas pokkalii TaxID=2175090 RepID=A0A2U0SEN3_9SPHN|nr:TonB-dependent hemoglobin/transferrin/lactoferrin family receptor [Sphingomonas pokkalii]PVX29823.1 TonB-dependent hemoglobin/transferrin/lactoferrin family receptor [Sphingomonas pokkalii]